MLFPTALLFHITGICLMAGATVADFILSRRFWALYARDRQQGIQAKKISDQLPRLIIAGIILILLSGVGMMAATNGLFGTMLWFRIKIVLVVLVILNGVLNGRRLGVKLNKLLALQPINELSLQQVRKKINLFYVSQLALFFIIFLLSAFKFN